MSEIKKHIGANIERYRKRLGLTQEQVAKHLNLETHASISYFENGTRPVPVTVLNSLANLFCLEVSDLLEMDESKARKSAAFAFRADNILENDLKNIASFHKIVKNYLKILRIQEKYLAANKLGSEALSAPKYDLIKGQIENLVVEKQAVEFRKIHEMDSDGFVNHTELLNKARVITVFKPLPSSFAGMALKHNNHVFMMVNSNHTLGKQNFTICHELYHLFVQKDFDYMWCNTEIFDRKKDKVEYYADLFASHLLIPNSGLLEKIPSSELKKDQITLGTIFSLEHYFQCSRLSLMYRLEELGLITEAKKNEFCTSGFSSKAKNFSKNTDLYKKGRDNVFIGDDYVNRLEELYGANLISQSLYLEMMFDVGKNDY